MGGEIVYGPLESRRLGRSLGVNITPSGCRACNFGCVYCDDTRPRDAEGASSHWPSAGEVGVALANALPGAGRLDGITIAGQGEPTLHPRLGSVVAAVVAEARRARPGVPVRILSNGSGVLRAGDRRALELLDERILKLDAAPQAVSRPGPGVSLDAIRAGYAQLSDVTIQACFVEGAVCNVDPAAVEAWLAQVRALAPRRVQVYTIDRPARTSGVRAASRPCLEEIAARVRREVGVPVQVAG